MDKATLVMTIERASEWHAERQTKKFYSLAQLYDFIKENGSIVLGIAHNDGTKGEDADLDLLIYDDYIE